MRKYTIQKVRKSQSHANAPRRASPHPRALPVAHSAAAISANSPPRLASTKTSGPNAPPEQNLLFTEPLVTPRGDGTFIVAPGKPHAQVPEVGSVRAAELLGIGLTALRAARESKLGRHYLRWRFTTEKQRVLVWEVPGLMAYKDATRSIGK